MYKCLHPVWMAGDLSEVLIHQQPIVAPNTSWAKCSKPWAADLRPSPSRLWLQHEVAASLAVQANGYEWALMHAPPDKSHATAHGSDIQQLGRPLCSITHVEINEHPPIYLAPLDSGRHKRHINTPTHARKHTLDLYDNTSFDKLFGHTILKLKEARQLEVGT